MAVYNFTRGLTKQSDAHMVMQPGFDMLSFERLPAAQESGLDTCEDKFADGSTRLQ